MYQLLINKLSFKNKNIIFLKLYEGKNKLLYRIYRLFNRL